MKNQAVVIAAQNGCQKSLATLYAKFFPLLKNSISHKLGGRRNSQQIEDIAQEAIIKGFERIQDYKPTHNFGSWLGRIAYNMMIDVARKSSKVNITALDTAVDNGDDDNFSLSNLIPNEDALPDMEMINEETKEEISAIIKASLGEDLQEVIRMRYFDGLSYNAIAEELDSPLGTIQAKLFRAHKALKKTDLASINS